MNIDMLEGQWKQIKGSVQSEWGELTDDELEKIDGDATRLIGLLQAKYGKSKDVAKAEVERWLDKINPT